MMTDSLKKIYMFYVVLETISVSLYPKHIDKNKAALLHCL